jgi:uncharacterized protein (TIGR02271 family)
MAAREPIGRQYGYGALPNDLVGMEHLEHDIAEGHPDPRGYELWSRDNQKIGTVQSLFGSPSTEAAYFALVEVGGPTNRRRYLIPLETLSIDARARRAYGPFTQAEFGSAPEYQENSRDFSRYYSYWNQFGSTAQRGTSEEVRVPVSEEQAQVRKEVREVGHVALRKRVEVETRHIQEPVTRTRVEVERHAVPADQQRGYRADAKTLQEGEEIRVPVMEEELIVEKVPRVTEEVVLRKETETRQAEQDVQLRREHVEVEEEGEVEVDAPTTSTRRHNR